MVMSMWSWGSDQRREERTVKQRTSLLSMELAVIT
jgi:hypothetical protein